MNLVVVSTLNPFATYVVGEVHRRWPIQTLIRPVWKPPAEAASPWSRLKKAPLATLQRGVHRRLYNRRNRRLDREISEKLFGAAQPPDLGIPITPVGHFDMNSEATAELIRAQQAELMIVCGAPILKSNVFSAPLRGAINVHLGVCPSYRGEGTLFWSLYFDDFAHLGFTIHEMNQGIDTGPILAQGFPPLDPGDTEATIVAKCAPLAAELLTDILQAEQASHIQGRPPGEPGPLFLARDWTLWKQMRYAFRRKVLGHRPPTQAASRSVSYSQCE